MKVDVAEGTVVGVGGVTESTLEEVMVGVAESTLVGVVVGVAEGTLVGVRRVLIWASEGAKSEGGPVGRSISESVGVVVLIGRRN